MDVKKFDKELAKAVRRFERRCKKEGEICDPVCIERTGRVFFDYFGDIVGEFLPTGAKLKKGLNLLCLQVVADFCEDVKTGAYRYPVVITKN